MVEFRIIRSVSRRSTIPRFLLETFEQDEVEVEHILARINQGSVIKDHNKEKSFKIKNRSKIVDCLKWERYQTWTNRDFAKKCVNDLVFTIIIFYQNCGIKKENKIETIPT